MLHVAKYGKYAIYSSGCVCCVSTAAMMSTYALVEGSSVVVVVVVVVDANVVVVVVVVGTQENPHPFGAGAPQTHTDVSSR